MGENINKDVCVVLTGSVDSGKCFGKGTKILKYNRDIINVEDVKINDILLGDDFTKRKVLETHSGIGPLYKISTTDKKEYIVNDKHILCLSDILTDDIVEISVEDYIRSDKDNIKNLKWFRNIPGKYRETVNFKICIVNTGRYYGFSVDNNKRFLLGDYSVVHNSSFIGVMAHGELDDGNGSARNRVAKHPHEIESGKTSDISVRTLKVKDDRNLVLVDLCGHEKYLKTTLYGITGYFPDYAVLVVAANRGMLPMTKEHLGILLYMNIPFIIIVTRVDLVHNNPKIYNRSIISIKKILKRYNKKAISINDLEDMSLPKDKLLEKEKTAKEKTKQIVDLMVNSSNLVPVITISNKTGYFFDVARSAIHNLKPRPIWSSENNNNESVFYIESRFNPKGIGIVISGLNKGYTIKLGDEMLLGPYNKEFIPVRIWSLHDNCKNVIKELGDKQYGCLAIRNINKKTIININKIKKGMILIKKGMDLRNVCYEFQAIIKILNHSTTISDNYTPVIHCGTIRQTARIKMDENKHLKLGDEAIVNFRFIGHPEFVETNSTFFFREGTTRGIGTVKDVIPLSEDPNKEPGSPRRNHRFSKKRRRMIKKERKLAQTSN